MNIECYFFINVLNEIDQLCIIFLEIHSLRCLHSNNICSQIVLLDSKLISDESVDLRAGQIENIWIFNVCDHSFFAFLFKV